MGSEILYSISVIALCAVTTWITRGLPFILFGRKKLPPVMQYLGNVLPPTIMVILVVYCLRSISFAAAPYGIPELISALLVACVQYFRKNMYLSIIAGTFCYMVLIRIL